MVFGRGKKKKNAYVEQPREIGKDETTQQRDFRVRYVLVNPEVTYERIGIVPEFDETRLEDKQYMRELVSLTIYKDVLDETSDRAKTKGVIRTYLKAQYDLFKSKRSWDTMEVGAIIDNFDTVIDTVFETYKIKAETLKT